MLRTQEIPWPRIFAEVAAIVVSILLAFSIQAWWEGRKDRALERELLESLIGEFEEAASEFEARWIGHEQRLVAATKLAELDEETIEQLSPEELKDLWNQAYSPSISDPPQGALTSAIATGRITLIRDPELKSHLTNWSGRLADLQHTEQNISDYSNNVLVPDMTHRALLPYISVVSTPDFQEAMLANSTKNHMNWIVLVTRVSQGENEQIQQNVLKILELLRKEIVAK